MIPAISKNNPLLPNSLATVTCAKPICTARGVAPNSPTATTIRQTNRDCWVGFNTLPSPTSFVFPACLSVMLREQIQLSALNVLQNLLHGVDDGPDLRLRHHDPDVIVFIPCSATPDH